MKKVLFLLFVMCSFCALAQDYSQFCSTNTARKTLSGNLASLSGFNSLTRNIIESSIQNSIKKETGSKFDVKINNFYGTNIVNGEFKSLKATSKKYDYNGIHLSNIELETICPYNHINYENERLYFLENMILKIKADLTKDDLTKTLKAEKIDSKLAYILDKSYHLWAYLPLITSKKPISLNIKIDKYNKAKLKIDKISFIDKKINLSGYIIIPKSK